MQESEVTVSHWQAYKPDRKQPWGSRRVAHLHRRVVFGATWNEHQRDLKDGPQTALDRIVNAEFRMGCVPPRFQETAQAIAESAIAQPDPFRLKAWWIYRVLFTADPLRERLTLMWHNHFATSNLKVNNLNQILQQNETLRSLAAANFGDLLHAMFRDPALLYWLDAPANRQGRANENLAREAMELFTLGIGNYTESDVKNAARALTGLSVKNGAFVFDQRRHDAGDKTILGTTRKFTPSRFADRLLRHPATATHIARCLVNEFFADGVVDRAAHQELEELLVDSQLDIGKVVETILRSTLFFSDANIGTRICDPMSFLAIPLRSLGLLERPPGTLRLSRWLTRMGLDLFYPPNVAGWPGGRAWLTTRTVIARSNYAADLAAGNLHRLAVVSDLFCFASGIEEVSTNQILETLLTGRVDEADQTIGNSSSGESNKSIAQRITLLLTGPEAHLH